jgi:predicted nucleotidyltransferase
MCKGADVMTSRPGSLADLATTRDLLLARLTTILASDSRVVAAWLSGSFGRNVDDGWSDLDLHVTIEDDAFPSFWEERDRLYHELGCPLLVQREMPSNAHHGGRFQLVIYPGPVEIDWNVGPVSRARRPAETRMLVARREVPVDAPPPLTTGERRERANEAIIFFWAMAPIAIKYAGRGESRRASSQIDLLTGTFIQLWRLVMMPDGPDPVAPEQNRGTETDLDATLPRLGRHISPLLALDVIRGLCAEVERLHPALEGLGVAVPNRMVPETHALAGIAQRELAAGQPAPRNVYR